MTIYPLAEFLIDLPDDAVEDEDDIVVFPGRALAEVIAEILGRLGYRVTPPDYAHELGWELSAYAGRRRVWLRVTQIFVGEAILLTEELPTLFQRLFRRKDSIHAKLLSELHREMSADPRFQQIRWLSGHDHRGVPAYEPVRAD